MVYSAEQKYRWLIFQVEVVVIKWLPTNGGLRVFSYFVCFHVKEIDINYEKCIEYGKYSDSQIDKPQRGCPKRAELPDVNINTGAQSINIERVY